MDTVVGGESASAGPEEKNPRLSSSTTDCCAPQKLPTDLFSSASPLQVLGATGTHWTHLTGSHTDDRAGVLVRASTRSAH